MLAKIFASNSFQHIINRQCRRIQLSTWWLVAEEYNYRNRNSSHQARNSEQVSTGGFESGRLRERQGTALRILIVQEPLKCLVLTVLPIKMLHLHFHKNQRQQHHHKPPDETSDNKSTATIERTETKSQFTYPRSSTSTFVLDPRFFTLCRVQQSDGADLRRLLARFLLQARVESVASLPRRTLSRRASVFEPAIQEQITRLHIRRLVSTWSRD